MATTAVKAASNLADATGKIQVVLDRPASVGAPTSGTWMVQMRAPASKGASFKGIGRAIASGAYRELNTDRKKGDRIAVLLHVAKKHPRLDVEPTQVYSAVRHVTGQGEGGEREGLEQRVTISVGDQLRELVAKVKKIRSVLDVPPSSGRSLRFLEYTADDGALLVDVEPAERAYVDQDGNPIIPRMQNPEWREDFARRHPLWTAREAAEQVGRGASNPPEFMRKLVDRRKIFRLRWKGEWRYPAFQFDSSGDPRPVIGKILEIMGEVDGDRAWRLAHFLDQPNGYLAPSAQSGPKRGRKSSDPLRPLDVLESQPDLLAKVVDRQFGSAVYAF